MRWLARLFRRQRDRVYHNTAATRGVFVEVSLDGKQLWVTVDGHPTLRVTDIPALTIHDPHHHGQPYID